MSLYKVLSCALRMSVVSLPSKTLHSGLVTTLLLAQHRMLFLLHRLKDSTGVVRKSGTLNRRIAVMRRARRRSRELKRMTKNMTSYLHQLLKLRVQKPGVQKLLNLNLFCTLVCIYLFAIYASFSRSQTKALLVE